MKSLFEQMGGTYSEINGYFIPNLTLPKEGNVFIGRYGRLHRDYLKKHKNNVYWELLYSGRLNTYLAEIDAQAKELLEKLTHEMANKQGISEAFKAAEQMSWVGAMNNIHNVAEEIVLNEIIYA